MPEFNFNRKDLTKKGKERKSIGGEYTGNVGRPKGCKLINKVYRDGDSQARYGHRSRTTSSNKEKDTPIKHGFHTEDYNRICVYEHYYNNEEKPFYVGCGTIGRAFDFTNKNRNDDYNDKVKDINKIRVKIVNIDCSKEDAYILEEDLIYKYKRIEEGGTLINICSRKAGGTTLSGKNNPNSIPVLQYNKKGELIAEYANAVEAWGKTGIDKSAIGKCCRNVPNYKTAGGYIWKYKENKI